MITRLENFKVKYTTLVRHFSQKTFRFPKHLDEDILELLEYLDSLYINPDTFLVANFRNYKPDDELKYLYPYVTYMLHNPMCVHIYQQFHKVHGDDIGIINYTPSLVNINKMYEDCYYWFSVKFDEVFKQKKLLMAMSHVFKCYYITTFKKDIKADNIGLYILDKLGFEQTFGLPYKTLERIYKSHLTS